MRRRAARGLSIVLSLAVAFPVRAADLEVDPSSTRLEGNDADLGATLAFRNGHRIPLRALVTAELVETGVVARGLVQATLSGTAPAVRLPLLPVGALHAEGRRELLL